MALSDLAVFSEYAQTTMTEMQKQQVGLFNSASQGGVILQSGDNEGDYSDVAMWAKIAGLVRRRNAYGSGTVTAKNLAQLVNTSVKVAAGTPPVNIDPGMLLWIQKSPEEAGVIVGRQLAEDSVADMLNTGVMGYLKAVAQVTAVVHDGTAATASLAALNSGASKFGDRSGDIVAWMMHSKVAFDIYADALANSNRLFSFGSVRVIEDGFGRPIIVTDSDKMITADGVGVGIDQYDTLGLSGGGILVQQNNDFLDNVETSNGDENIARTYQAEWSYNLGIKGFAWDKANGGASPTDAALGTATNWDRTATSNKDLAGVIVSTR